MNNPSIPASAVATPPTQPSSLLDTTQRALALAARGELALAELFATAEQLSQAGHVDIAIELYRAWLVNTDTPATYAVRFNLASLLLNSGDNAGAEALYRQALAQRPAFLEARVNLGVVLERTAREQEAQDTWRTVLALSDPDGPDRAIHAQARHNLARLRAHLSSLRRAPVGADNPAPLVSILIPTHNRPDYAELALQSALAQTYPNIEIIVSDNSDDELTRERFAPYVASNPCVRYSRVPGYTAMENGANCYRQASGEYINWLMDDDLFHPEKIQKMMMHMLAHPNVGMVTSVRQLINARGEHMAAPPDFQGMFQTDTVVSGKSLASRLLNSGQNTIGEPTTVLFRKADLPSHFGVYHERQFTVLSDMASWTAILAGKDCIYLSAPLSYFRIHGEQDQRQRATQIRGHMEGFQLFCDAYEHDMEIFAGQADIHEVLTAKLLEFVRGMARLHEDFKTGAFDLEQIHAAVRQANTLLLTR